MLCTKIQGHDENSQLIKNTARNRKEVKTMDQIKVFMLPESIRVASWSWELMTEFAGGAFSDAQISL